MPILKNPKDEIFAQQLAAGATQSDAYRAAYPRSRNWKNATVANKAYIIAKDPDIEARVAELLSEAATRAVMQRQERMEALTEIARNGAKQDRWRIQAIEVLNKMDGTYSASSEDAGTTSRVVIINDTRMASDGTAKDGTDQ